MENNDQTNYELGVLNEDLNRTSKLIQNFSEENQELQKAIDFDPKEPKSCLNILNKMKFINAELKSFKEKVSSMFELVAVYPNFSKNPILDENKALEKCNLLTTQLFATNDDNIINEMLLSMDETYDNPSEMKKYNEYQNFHNKLIEKILENSFQNEKKKY